MGRAGISLSPREHALLERHFAHELRGDKVNWKAFYAQLQQTPCPAEEQLEVVGQVSGKMREGKE